MLEVENLTTRYGQKRILDQVSFTVRSGEVLAIVGESGTGKTTLGFAILGMLSEFSKQASADGKVKIDDLNINELDKESIRKLRWNSISIVMQNVDDALNPTITIYDQIKEVLDNKKDNGVVTSMLEKVDFPVDRKDAYPHQLSMGERQKVLIAMAFISNPKVVVLDEPTSSLDQDTKDMIIGIIRRLCKHKAVVLFTHDLDTARKLSGKIMVLYSGTVMEYADTKKLLSNPKHPYSRALIRSYPDSSRTKDLQGIKGRAEFIKKGCPFYKRCTQSIGICRIKKPDLEKNNGSLVACHRGGIIPFLKLNDISKEYDNKGILKSINLTLFEGETVTLLGKSGTGKTTLAKIIMGLVRQDGGKIYLENRKIKKFGLDYYRKVQMVFQDTHSSLSHRMNILNIVIEPLVIQGIGTRLEKIERAKRILSEVELPASQRFLNEYPHHLSGGETQRLVIARALMLEPKLLIADEPTSSLDASVQAKIMKLLNNIQENRGLAILFITHNQDLARKVSDRIVKLENGIIR